MHLLWSRIGNKLWAVQHSWESCISRSVGHFHVFTVARLINCSVTNRAIKPANKSKLCQWSAAHLSTPLSPLSFLFSRREGLSKQPGRPISYVDIFLPCRKSWLGTLQIIWVLEIPSPTTLTCSEMLEGLLSIELWARIRRVCIFWSCWALHQKQQPPKHELVEILYSQI